MTRGVWKGVNVQRLTFRNLVLCMKPETRAGLDVHQRVVSRLAVGARSKTTNEAVQGLWAGRRFRQKGGGRSKIKFKERLRDLEEKRISRDSV